MSYDSTQRCSALHIFRNDIRHMLAVGLAVVAVVLTGCSKSPVVKYTYDREVDFSKLKTFTIAPNKQQIIAPRMLNGRPMAQTIQESISEALVRRGFVPGSDPARAQLLVRWLGDISYSDAVSHGSPGLVDPGSTDAAYGMAPAGLGGGGSSSSYLVQQGALTLDVVEPGTNHSVWRGTVSSVMKPDLPDPERVKRLNKALAKLLANLPPPGK